MTSEYTRVGPVRNPNIFQEVEPISPYPRVDPQQQKSDQRRRYPRERGRDEKDQRRRRFTAMRRLVGTMKGASRFQRVDFNTADREMRDAGLKVAEEELIAALLQLKFPLRHIEQLFQELRRNPPRTILSAGRRLLAGNRLIVPESPEGLSEYNLVIQDLLLPSNPQNSVISEDLENSGRYVYEQERLRLSFSWSDSPPSDRLKLTLSILVGAVEIDDGGRRVMVFQRPDQSYGLYADKQIDLSI